MSDFGDSPDPVIVQLRFKLATLMMDPDVFRALFQGENPAPLIVALDECVSMCDWLMAQHPSLTGDYFTRIRTEE